MLKLITKENQFHQTIFGGRFQTNKPVKYGAMPHVAPYSSIFYWSHGVALEDVEFPLHPHEGFEIMSFVISGENLHYDTETRVWTPLYTGDFQVIQANSGVSHSEKILKGTRAFQIWFDPNFRNALQKTATYADYKASDFKPEIDENGIETTTYIGTKNGAKADTEGLKIQRISFVGEKTIPLDSNSTYGFYLLDGSCTTNGAKLEANDALMIEGETSVTLDLAPSSSFFVIKMPIKPSYQTVWN